MKSYLSGICGVTVLVCAMCAALRVTLAADVGQRTGGNARSYALTCPEHDYMLQDFDSGREAVVSPDRRKRAVLAKNGTLDIFSGKQEIGTVELPEISADVAIVWAPDGQKFAVTYSNGGDEGAFHGHVYGLAENRVIELSKVATVAFDDFKKQHYCEARGNNEYVLGWGPESKTVLVVAQVFPTGDCGQNFGKMGGYLMDSDGNILRRYDDKTAERITNACWKSGRALVR